MAVLWFLQRPEHGLGKPAVFVSLASCPDAVDEFFSVRLSDFCSFSFALSCFDDSESLQRGLPCLCVACGLGGTKRVQVSCNVLNQHLGTG